MKFLSQVRLATLLVSAAVGAVAVAQAPTTVDSLQYDGQGPWEFHKRAINGQGLDALASRGKVVRPFDVLLMDKPPEILPPSRHGVIGSVRTIFRDLYTGAEVWRVTSSTTGVDSHAGSFSHWNANGRLIRFSGGTMLMDQETCAMIVPQQAIGLWSPSEPYIMFYNGVNNGVRASWVYDVQQRKVLRHMGPLVKGAGAITSVTEDGQWVSWLEGGQDTARRFAIARTDGSLYRGIRWDGGVIHEQSPATTEPPLPTTAGDSAVRGGMHGIRFTRSPNHILKTSLISDIVTDRAKQTHWFNTDGKLIDQTRLMSHAADGPDGKSHIYEDGDGISGRDLTTGRTWRVFQSKGRTEGHMNWTHDPNWAACSWMGPVGWEMVRMSMREDASIIRLCGVCPEDPKALTYQSMPHIQISPDGTKAMFMSSMLKSVNEYIVVAANPRTPQNLTSQWTAEGLKLTWVPNVPSRETKGYRIYQTDKSGQNYRQIGWVDTPEDRKVYSLEPISFTVPGVKQGEKVFFAVRAQEWSGLLSRYSNDVASDASMPVATYIEPELGEFTGFKQGFDPINASDMYYLFVPTNEMCSISFTNPNKDAQVWVRVGGPVGSKFMADTTRIFQRTAEDVMEGDWKWVNLGNLSGEITLGSNTKGFKLDRIFLTSDGSIPTGLGLDYPTAASTTQTPTNVQIKLLRPFTAEVTWAAIPGVRYYNVYVSDKPDFVPAQSNLLYSPPVGTERVVDWGLKPGTQYYYKVAAVDYDGVSSQPTAAVALMTPTIAVQTVNVD
ncbi:MAG: fibronectin type III domain-containing protein, partial [Phycisphaerales bacterium]|nr:fibronectin type III domain-containing protein [Phycisphaerales bacterium]